MGGGNEILCHKRMLSFFYVVGIGTPPTPLPQTSVPSSPFGSGGRGTLAAESGGWESLNSAEGTYTVVLYVYMYFVSFGYLG